MILEQSYGQYRMKLVINKAEDEEIPTKAQVSMYDVSERLPLIWSRTLPIKKAHAALKLFEGIGYYSIA